MNKLKEIYFDYINNYLPINIQISDFYLKVKNCKFKQKRF